MFVELAVLESGTLCFVLGALRTTAKPLILKLVRSFSGKYDGVIIACERHWLIRRLFFFD